MQIGKGTTQMSRNRSSFQGDNNSGGYSDSYGSGNVPMVRNVFFRRVRGCPLSGEGAPIVDYKNTDLLSRYISERGRIIPSRISSISAKMQRKLAKAIKQARQLALLPFIAQ